MGEAPKDRAGNRKRGTLVIPVWAAAAALLAGFSVAGSGCSSGQQNDKEVERLRREVQLLKENQALKEKLAVQQSTQGPVLVPPNSAEVERLRLENEALRAKQLEAERLALEERKRALAEREARLKASEQPPPGGVPSARTDPGSEPWALFPFFPRLSSLPLLPPVALLAVDVRDSVVEPEGVAERKGPIVVRLQVEVYGLEAIQKATHRFTEHCFVHLDLGGDGYVECRFESKSGGQDLRSLAGEFTNQALDEALRARLATETEPLRRLLLAQAFSRTNILHPDLDESDPAADPKGVGVQDRQGP